MKKLIMFVMVLMLCMGTAAKAELVAAWDFNDTLDSYPQAGNYPAEMYAGAEAYDSEGAPPGGSAIALDGTNSVKLPIEAVNPLNYEASSSIVMWFKVPALPAGTGALLISSARDDTGDNHALALFLNGEGNLRIDLFWVATVEGETAGLDDGTWHHAASVFDSASGETTLYVDGVEDGANADINQTIPNIEEDTVLIGDTMNEEFPAEEGVVELVGSIAHVGIYDHALTVGEVGDAMDNGFPGFGPKNPLAIDPNAMDVYETNTTEGNFGISLKFPPEGQGSPGNPDGTPFTVNIIVDPNGFDGGGNADIGLIGGSGIHGRISFSRDAGNWDTPEVIRFKAKQDTLAEGPTLDEAQNIVVWAEPVATTEPNWSRPVAQKVVGGTVWDNDQANILFTFTKPEPTGGDPRMSVIGPVKLWEQPRYWFAIPQTRWREIGITLQVKPLIDGDPCKPTSVKLNLEVVGEVEGDNLPMTDPCGLPYLEIDEPNGLIFTAANYETRQSIKIWGVDDAALQVLGGEEGDVYPSAEGEQNYQATLVVTVIDGGGDARYRWLGQDPEDPCGPEIMIGLEKEVQFDIEDNECGAFGTLAMDVGNPYYVMDEVTLGGDPNDYVDDDGNPLPDCYVNIYDVIETARRWLDCTDPQTAGCVQLND